MTTQQPPESQSQHAQYWRFRRLLHLITDTQKHGLQKGVMINGTGGVGKTIGVEAFLSTKNDRK